MHSTGILFLGKTRPVAEKGTDGVFRLTLLLIDNQGRGKEAYRVRWVGDEARAFWERHRDHLKSGTVLRAELANARAYIGTTYPPLPELRADVVRLEYLPPKAAATTAGAEATA